MRHFSIQLIDSQTKQAINIAGGKAYVTAAGSIAKATLYTKAGAALANPVALNYGMIDFHTADAVALVDLYIQSPTGHFTVVKAVLASGPNAIYIDRSQLYTVMVIPFSIADTTAATETSTGFICPTKGIILPQGAGIEIVTVDSGMTIDVGTLASDSGDADGFIDGISLTTAGLVKATLANGAVTLGALLKVQDSANAGDAAPEGNVSMSGKTITYTLSASTDTGAGFIKIPCMVTTNP